ncbi:tRNA-intron lyase [Candidatus Woesearchaeota archaeon CG08_land_8_20_14_0_20_47_9]|nr:MAG: tRNA-intron lyase [Candidatus Woesearchaeota archaeon CG08_land_8_20_14_0_20_47_9]HII30070.1 tRNA-intron lyase [Candidatus Woesearchaeota archaeon]
MTAKAQSGEEEASAAKQRSEPIRVVFSKGALTGDACEAANELYNQSRFGNIANGKLHLSPIEGLYLLQKGKAAVYDGRGRPVGEDEFIKRASRFEPRFWIRFQVFKDIRDRGYIIKTALKFGADFRVYDRGIKPGEDHAKWVVYPVYEGEHLTWYEFAAKNRVAHSTKKRLLIAIVDDELDVTYYEIRWMRP